MSEHKINPEEFKGVNPMPVKSWHADMCEMGYNLNFVHQNRGISWKDNDGTEFIGFNFNPYITDKDGNKVYYQRDLCWTLEDKQNFIESVYNELNCGVIVLRYNSDKRLAESGAEWDVVDGKQRLSTLIEFFNNEFPDRYGNYWKDFSVVAQRHFKNIKCMTFYEFRENVSDEDIKRAFLNVNFTGVPMSKEHIEFVKSINV